MSACTPPPQPHPSREHVTRCRDSLSESSSEHEHRKTPEPRGSSASRLAKGILRSTQGKMRYFRPELPVVRAPSAGHLERLKRRSTHGSPSTELLATSKPTPLAACRKGAAAVYGAMGQAAYAGRGTVLQVAARRHRVIEHTALQVKKRVRTHVDALAGLGGSAYARARGRVVRSLQSTLGSMLAEVYVNRIKPTLTPDRRMPFPIRQAVHEMVDEVWDNVQIEVTRALDKLLTPTKEEERARKEAKGAGNDSSRSCATAAAPALSPPASPPEMPSSGSSAPLRAGDPSSSSEEEEPEEEESGTLRVTVLHADDLLAADLNGLSDPFARLYVCGRQRRTRVVYKSLHPVWDEVLEWSGTAQKIFSSRLEVKVYDYDFASFNDFLGHATLPLGEVGEQLRTGELYSLNREERTLRLSKQGSITLRFEWLSKAACLSAMQPPPNEADELPVERLRSLRRAPTITDVLDMGQQRTTVLGSLVQSVKGFNCQAVKRALQLAEVELTLVAGRNLGKKRGNIFVKLLHRCAAFDSLAIHGAHGAHWNQSFTFRGTIRELLSMPIVLHVLDSERTLDDNFVGSSSVNLAEMLDNPRYHTDTGSGYLSHISPNSSILLKLRVTTRSFGWPAIRHLFNRHILEPLGMEDLNLQEFFHDLIAQETKARVSVTLHSAKDLLAADVDLFGSSSDPFVNLTLGGETKSSSTLYRTLNPVWDESFEFCCELHTLLQSPLEVNVFDADVLSAHDFLGGAVVDFTALLHATAHKCCRAAVWEGEKVLKLPLSTQGSVKLSVSLGLEYPPLWQVIGMLARRLILCFRAFLLYQRQPYDRTIWTKIRDPWYFVFLAVASSPNVIVRGLFFSIFLACIAFDNEEYQLQRYILALKGSQYISGLLHLVFTLFGIWECLSLSERASKCATSAPGISASASVASQICMVVWIQLLCWSAFIMLPFSRKYDQRMGTFIERDLPDLEEDSLDLEESTNDGSSKFAAMRRTSTLFSKDMPVEEVDIEEALEPRPLLLDRLYLQYLEKRALLTSMVRKAQFALLHTENRLFYLLKWDLLAFSGCMLLLIGMSTTVLVHSEMDRELLQGVAIDHTLILDYLRALVSLFDAEVWKSYQLQFTFIVVKITFSLSSFPFFLFTIFGEKLFTHTDATAYDRNGNIVALDTTGLSAYITWLREDILHNEKHVANLLKIDAKDLDSLGAAIKQAEQAMEEAKNRPSSSSRLSATKKKELDRLLAKVITLERSPELFSACFPDKVLVEAYKRRQAELLQKDIKLKKAYDLK